MGKFIGKIIPVYVLIITVVSSLHAGWSHHTHINYIKEAIRILPIFDYEMCVYYKNHLIEGAVEGEIHYRYIANGTYPSWLPKLSTDEIQFLNGIPINEHNVTGATGFFTERFETLRKDIELLEKSYANIFFELGYYLHSINNTLIPEYHGGKCPWQQVASNTDSFDINTSQVEKIVDLREWLEKTFRENLRIRGEWTKSAESEDKDGFIKIAQKAHERNIYNTASLIQYVLNDCFGPADPGVRKKVAAIHDKKMNTNGGRKPGI